MTNISGVRDYVVGREMPIYEYFCNDCNVVFSFMSNQVAPSKIPQCPKCSSQSMIKHLSSFSSPASSGNTETDFDEAKVESGFTHLLDNAAQLTEKDASNLGDLMVSFTKECGYEYTESMKSTLSKISTDGKKVDGSNPKDLLVELDVSTGVDGDKDRDNVTDKRKPPEVDPNIYQL